MNNGKKMIRIFFVMLASFISMGAVSNPSATTFNATTNTIIGCFAVHLNKKGYTVSTEGRFFPFNAKEFSVYNNQSQFAGSFWIESYTEGRPDRYVSTTHVRKDAYNVFKETLYQCKNELSDVTNGAKMVPVPAI